jgi:propanol-preferring alcohol dehydrogenase
MQAVRLRQVRKPLEEEEVELPEIGPPDVLIRVAACGICHSDEHFRAGISRIDHLPVTLGHEIAGRIEKVGADVRHVAPGDRVCVHYLAHCGSCEFCARGLEQFCRTVQMIGKHRDGGYAEFIKVPGRNAFVLPDPIPFEIGAIMMCSSATALHALKKARLKPGDSIAIFGFGGLGFSALQLARAFDCEQVYVVEINPAKLGCFAGVDRIGEDDATSSSMFGRARSCGACRINRGVDVALSVHGIDQQGGRDHRRIRSSRG